LDYGLNIGKRIRDGIPQLQQFITTSQGSIPSRDEYSSCCRQKTNNFYLYEVPESVKKAPNNIWTKIRPDLSALPYATESDIVRFVIDYLEDILLALNLNFFFSTNLGIKNITPDICILTYGNRLVGVVEVKKPGRNILLQPTVLGELLDQLLLVEGFYCSGPVIGILTTLKE